MIFSRLSYTHHTRCETGPFNHYLDGFRDSFLGITVFRRTQRRPFSSVIRKLAYHARVALATARRRLCHRAHGGWRACIAEFIISEIIFCSQLTSNFCPISRGVYAALGRRRRRGGIIQFGWISILSSLCLANDTAVRI